MKSVSAGTDGGETGTKNSIGLRTWSLIVGLFVLANSVNITSALFTPAAKRGFAMWEIAVWEGSSCLVLIACAPVVFWAFDRFSVRKLGWARFIGSQIAFCLLFSLVHVTGMALIRKAVYALAGHSYDFTHGRPLIVFAYEVRKDIVTYLIFVLFFWVDLRNRGKSEPAEPISDLPKTIELRIDGKRVFLEPADIVYAEAAGNYVEIHSQSRTFLVRGTLATYEDRLKPFGFTRIHRSSLVNKAYIHSIDTAQSGDMRITLKDGRVLAASRRYREGLSAI
jgi:hypothetical protein